MPESTSASHGRAHRLAHRSGAFVGLILGGLLAIGQWGFAVQSGLAAEAELRLALFDVDASPPIGSPMAYDPTNEVLIPLSCRGVVLLGAGDPIVLCAVDWIGIGNGGHQAFRSALAEAAGTTIERVAVHSLHQHDAPWCDFTVDALLAQHGENQRPFDTAFGRRVMVSAASAVRAAVPQAQPVTHVGAASAVVDRVASNRRILGPDGRVAHVRYTATQDPALREMPEGTIDPQLRMITLWNGERPLVALSYYATHPQSYYRTGKANPDFPGIARNQRQQLTGVPHVHFTGAGGNVGAGKYNDGAPANRQVLADRVADAMRRAWDDQQRRPLVSREVRWQSLPVALPPAPHLDRQALEAVLADVGQPSQAHQIAASKLVWLDRCRAGGTIDVGCLTLGEIEILHMPGELFVEYQLAAKARRPDQFVAVAAYGDYGPWYIGTAAAYEEGGYETEPRSSNVGPEVEQVLTSAMEKLLTE